MSAPAPPIVLRWTPQRPEFDEAISVFRRSQGGLTLVFPHVGALSLLLVGLGMLLAGQLFVATLAAVGAVLLAVFGVRITNRGLWNNPVIRQPQEAIAGWEGLRVSGPNGTMDWRWTAYDRAVETPHTFVLLGARTGKNKMTPIFCYLPKSAAPHPVEIDRLRALLGHVLAGGVRPR